MAYERQRALRDELNARFPKIKRDLGQQMFRSAYFNDRMAGLDQDDAERLAIEAVRRHIPGFAPAKVR